MLSLLLALAGASAFPYQSLATPASCTAPAWPREALRYEIEGTTTLEFRIGSDGAVRDAKVRGGSGWAMLDQAALAGLARCRFKPGLEAARDGTVFPIQYAWRLDGPAPLRPVLQPGSCKPSPHIAGYANLDQRRSTQGGIKLRFLVGADGQARGIVAEQGGFAPQVVRDAVAYVSTCRFGIAPGASGERTDTSYGWVLLK
ncbi:TonB family protein [Pseudoduganella sp. DS3]|uniref:TonB family protein n=1 Tax=Pseudoduganella guangdongensis TaxID=2692179 RepID=A0A6N9HNB9_9BURK|nr:energy transducer TonB [Pseudoduganella guangdongensis]MYN05020.1 TonB family protein [Pseudoduganella guangdongensis]